MSDRAPIALRELDAHIGSRTVEGFDVANDEYPHLRGLAVVLEQGAIASFHASEYGLGGSHISINPDTGVYTDYIRSGFVSARMYKFAEFYRGRGITPRIPELVTANFLHELGHADHFHDYIDRGGGTSLAFEEFNRNREAALATLPLKTTSSAAKNAWDNNTDGYRDAMQALGYNEVRFEQLLEANGIAYAQTPLEVRADTFALGVLAKMYS